MEDLRGIFLIKIIKANLTRDTELLMKMAPYVTLENESSTQKLRTTAKQGGGKTPEWQEVFAIKVKLGEKVSLQVFDKDKFNKDDLIGEAVLVCEKEYVNMKNILSLELYFEGKICGKLHVDVEFLPDTESMKCIKNILEKYLLERTEILAKYKKGEIVEVEKNLDSIEETKKEITDKRKALEEQIRIIQVQHEDKVKKMNKQIDENDAERVVLKTDIEILKKKIAHYVSKSLPGTFVISIYDLKLKTNIGGYLDKMDPFVIVSLGKKKYQTKVKNDAGLNAVYNEVLEIPRIDEEELLFEVVDENSGGNKAAAYKEVAVHDYLYGRIDEKLVLNLCYKGKHEGTLTVGIAFKENK